RKRCAALAPRKGLSGGRFVQKPPPTCEKKAIPHGCPERRASARRVGSPRRADARRSPNVSAGPSTRRAAAVIIPTTPCDRRGAHVRLAEVLEPAPQPPER